VHRYWLMFQIMSGGSRTWTCAGAEWTGEGGTWQRMQSINPKLDGQHSHSCNKNGTCIPIPVLHIYSLPAHGYVHMACRHVRVIYISKSEKSDYNEAKAYRCIGHRIRLTTLPSVSLVSGENMGASTSHNPMGLHGLLQG
jgi:hypothetical protein